MPSSRGSSQPRDRTQVSSISCTGRWILCHQATRMKPILHPCAPDNWPGRAHCPRLRHTEPSGLLSWKSAWGIAQEATCWLQKDRLIPLGTCIHSLLWSTLLLQVGDAVITDPASQSSQSHWGGSIHKSWLFNGRKVTTGSRRWRRETNSGWRRGSFSTVMNGEDWTQGIRV